LRPKTKLIALNPLEIKWLLPATVCAFLCGCSSPQKTRLETPPPAPPPQAVPQQVAALPDPDLNQVQQTLKRVLKDTAQLDTTHQPSFIAGDFNGDESQDIAVIVKPAPGKLDELNEESPPWMVKDPLAPNQPGTQPLRVAENESLLAVIHGYGPKGWRDPEATQTYLLKNVVGSSIAVRPSKEFVAANKDKKLPPVHGDLIGEVLQGKAGYLYYTRATYSWYDPKTFKGEAPAGVFHGGQAMGAKK
jgi:hypothetical protein